MQPFLELRLHWDVSRPLDEIRKRNPALGKCLDTAFHEILQGRLVLSDPIYIEKLPRYAEACGFIIMVTDLGETGVVTGLQEWGDTELGL